MNLSGEKDSLSSGSLMQESDHLYTHITDNIPQLCSAMRLNMLLLVWSVEVYNCVTDTHNILFCFNALLFLSFVQVMRLSNQGGELVVALVRDGKTDSILTMVQKQRKPRKSRGNYKVSTLFFTYLVKIFWLVSGQLW